MPNFNTHWCVALAAIPGDPPWIRTGYDAYVKAAREMAENVRRDLLGAFRTEPGKKPLTPSELRKIAKNADAVVKKRAGGFLEALQKGPSYDEATAFSAYCLGACGPDFWTLTQPSDIKRMPNPWGEILGTAHFDLGHYNRTHAQFRVSAARVNEAAKGDKSYRTSLQGMLEQSYFLGMATHVAADLTIHQLVNRSAGAYNLLDKKWENEHGNLTKNIWSTHNKVEHFWDSYLRFRYLGDYGGVFPAQGPRDAKGLLPTTDGPGAQWFTPHGLPVLERLLEYVESAEFQNRLATVLEDNALAPPTAELCKAMRDSLDDSKVRYAYEKPLTLPQLFCDRLMAGRGAVQGKNVVRAFIFDVVVKKDAGAYPARVAPQAAADEAAHKDMDDGNGPSEVLKAKYFSSARNASDGSSSNNYLTYFVCPNLERVRQYGNSIFYDLAALQPFIDRAARQASAFLAELSSAYNGTQSFPLLANHWNLDTGIGLRIRRVKGDTPREVITRLDFLHVFQDGGAQGATPTAGDGYLAGITKTSEWNKGRKDVKPAFPVIQRSSGFPREKDKEPHAAVKEENGEFLPRVRLVPPLAARNPPQLKIAEDDFAAFFQTDDGKPLAKPVGMLSKLLREKNTVSISEVRHRLNLQIRCRISPLGNDGVGMVFFGDKKGVEDPVDGTSTHDWLRGGTIASAARILDHSELPESEGGLKAYQTQLFANLEPKEWLKDVPRKDGAKDKPWNNVVPWDDHRKDYGCNFAISTCRKNVLHPINSGNFDPSTHYEKYTDISPTEQIFFSVRALVRTREGVYDVLSQKRIADKDEMKTILKIEEIGFVKVVLFYDLTKDGAAMLPVALIDGELVQVEEVTD